MRHSKLLGAALVGVTLGLGAGAATAQDKEITLWSHWADQQTKVAFIEEVARRFEEKNPGSDVKITWYQKNPLNEAVKAALQAAQAPDIFYCEPAQTEYVENGFLLDLTDKIDWNNVEDWARATWTFEGKTYAIPLEAFTVELYYNGDKLKELGVTLPEARQLSQAEFLDLIKKSAAAGLTPIVVGVGDRPFPGAYLTEELLLKKLGIEDYDPLLKGQLSWADERVVDVLTYIKELVDAGAFPPSISTMKLGESHTYFYSNPGGLTLPMGSWYTSRAFNPPEQGGQPADFPLGIMHFPAPDNAACPECKTAAIGGSFCVNADSQNPDLAVGLLKEMSTPEMGTHWLTTVLVQTGVKSDPSAITGEHKDYFDELQAVNANAKFYSGGIPDAVMQGECREAFRQVINAALPAGQIEVDDAVETMNQACGQG